MRSNPRGVSWAVICLALLMVGVSSFTFKELQVSADTLAINTTATYTVLYERYQTNSFSTTAWATTPLNTTSNVVLTFPTQYSLTDSVTCLYQINSTGNFFSTACTRNNNELTITGIFPDGTLLRTLTLQINNVLNPSPSGTTGSFEGSIGADTASSIGVNSVVTLVAATSTCSFTFSPTTVYSTANMVFTVTTANQFPTAGTIGIQYPLTRVWSQDLNSSRSMPISTSMTCSSNSGNVNSAVQCTGNAGTAVVTLTNVVTATLNSGTTLSFSVNNFISPPTNQPVDEIVVTTYTGGNAIDQCSAYVTGLVPKTIPSSQFLITETDGNPMIVNQQYTLKFDITTLDAISRDDIFKITFPSEVSINNFATASIGGTVGFDTGASTYDTSTRLLTLHMLGSGTINAGQLFIIITNFVAPPSTETTGNFELSITNSNGFAKMSSTQTITASAGSITSSATMATSTVNAATSYTFSITLNDGLTSAGRLKIVFPTVLTVADNSNCAVASGTSLASSPTCTYSSLENSIVFSALNTSSSNIGAQTLTLQVSGITNPSTTATTPTFAVSSFYTASDASLVASGTAAGVTATIASISHTSCSVWSDNTVTSATGVSFYFSCTVTNPISMGGYLLVSFTDKIVFDTTNAALNCQLGLNGSALVSTSCTATLSAPSYIFNYTSPFPSTTIGANTNITLVVLSSATNPPSTLPVSPFSFQTFGGDGAAIASLLNQLTYTVSTPSTFTQFQFGRLSHTNGAITTYIVTLTQIAELEANGIILVTFPADTVPSLTSSCSLTYPSTTQTVACILSGQQFKVTSIGSAIAAGANFVLTFTNIRNPLSFAPLSGFSATTKTSNDIYFYSSSSSTNSLSNNVPTDFATFSHTYSPQQLDTAITLQLTFTISQSDLMPGHLQITIDPYFTAGTLTCSGFVDFTGSCSVLANDTIRVDGSFNNSVMGLTIEGFSSPTTAPSTTTFTAINSFDSGGFKIDQNSNTISFSLACTLPCKTCDNANTSSCLSCYNNTAVTSSVYFYSTNSQCYTTCPATTYNDNSTFLCAACDSNCLECSGSATFCTRCSNTSSFPYLNISSGNQICVANCVAGMYPDTNLDPTTCVACVSPCATCSAETVCITCASGNFLDNGTCTTTCPADTTIANSATNTCDPCDSQCLRCSGTTSNCTACASPLVFYNGSCQTECPAGGNLAPNNGVCTACDSTCLTCSQSITNCTSCDLNSANPFLVSNACLTACPSQFYNVTITGTCVACSTAGINCNDCSSATTCNTCDNNFLLFNSSCINSVPTGYVNISGVLQACTGDCATCSVTTSNCTSCSTLNLEGNTCVSTCTTGSVAINRVCVACTSPCATCTNTQTNCSSCLSGLTPAVFLHINACQQTCPDLFYANTGNNQCSACVSPCLTCSSASACLSCTNGTFLSSTSCVSTCPDGTTGLNSLCQACTGNCRTCSGSTSTCLTCNTNTYLLNSSSTCVTDCGTGLFIDLATQTCVGCTSPCQTCSNSTNTCTSCVSGLLFNNQCLSTCPDAMFELAGSCSACDSVCSTCTSASNCSACTGSNLLYNNFCVASCPSTASVISNGACQACSTANCFECTSGDVCTACNSGSLFFNTACVTTCPSGYQTNGTHCESIVNSALTDESSAFPVPFTIAGVVLIIACLMSRLQFNETYLSGAIYSFISILQCAALVVFLYLYWQSDNMDQPIALYIGLGALGYLYIMNIIAIFAQSIFLCYEKEFVAWRDSSGFNKCFSGFAGFLSLFVNHKFRNILFCKLFTFRIFSAKLDHVNHFRIFNIFSLISLVHSGGAIFAAALALPKTDDTQQLYMQCIDVIVLTSLNLVMAFFNTHKDKDFFNEYTTDGMILHKKHNMNEEFLMGEKISMEGMDGQMEQGFHNKHAHAVESKQALIYDSSDMGYSESSSANIVQAYNEEEDAETVKEYEDISVQAAADTTQIPPQPSYSEKEIQAEGHGINESQLPPQTIGNGTSDFTTYFHKVDQSVQGWPDKGLSIAMQYEADINDVSVQDDRQMVDLSIQKYPTKQLVDCSIQKYEVGKEDISIQHYAEVEGVDASVQEYPPARDFSIQQQGANYQDISIQNQPFNQADISIQHQAWSNADISVQHIGINQDDISIQHQGFGHEDVSIQNDPAQREFSVQHSLAPEKADISIQPSEAGVDKSVEVSYRVKSVSIQEAAEQSEKEIGVQPSVRDVSNQLIIDQQDEQIQIAADMSDVGIQPSVKHEEIAIQYEPDRIKYDEFEQELQEDNTPSNVFYDEPSEAKTEERMERHLIQENIEPLQIKEGVKSYQQELEDRIRNKEKELQEIKRKIDIKERVNSRKREDIRNMKTVQQEDIAMDGIKYMEQKPTVVAAPPARSFRREPTRKTQNLSEHDLAPQSSNPSRVLSRKSKGSPEAARKSGLNQLQLESKEMPIRGVFVPQQQEPERSQEMDKTIEEIQVPRPPQPEPAADIIGERENTIQELPAAQSDIPAVITNKPSKPSRPERKKIEYREIQDQLLSEQQPPKSELDLARDEIIRQNSSSAIPQRDLSPVVPHRDTQDMAAIVDEREYSEIASSLRSKRESHRANVSPSVNNIRPVAIQRPRGESDNYFQMEDEQLASSLKSDHIKRDSQITRKNDHMRRKIAVDVTEMDRELSVQDKEEMIEFDESEPEPTGIINAPYSKPRFNHEQAASDLSNTIQEIPRHNVRNQNDKTLSHHDLRPQRDRQPYITPTRVTPDSLTNYFAGNMPQPERHRPKDMPVETDTAERFHITRLYSKKEFDKSQVGDPAPVKQGKSKNNTFAIAGKAQFTDDSIKRKESKPNPLNSNTARQQWQAANEDKYISDEEDDNRFRPGPNRQNLAKKPSNKTMQNFASHMALPQQAEKQRSHQQAIREERGPTQSTRGRQQRAPSKQEVEEIEVHFEADQLSRELSIRQKNESPSIPQGLGRGYSNNGDSEYYEDDEGQQVDYRNMMLMNQMQQRPGNNDLQDYYNQRNRSKERRRTSNSKQQQQQRKSTEKIYMQRLDKRRY